MKMKPKDPIWNFYNTLNDKKKNKKKKLVLGALIVMQKLVLRLMMSTLGRDETLIFFLFLLNMNTKTWPNISGHHKTQPPENSNRPLQTNIDQ